jgi:oxygen-dependent protoporphyrinogen oxidase
VKAIVIGAGIAGLAAAYDLRNAGWATTVVEADSRVGGRVIVTKKQGYHLEPIASSVLTGYGDYLKLAEELGIEKELVPGSSSTLLMRGGRLYNLDSNRAVRSLFSGALPLASKVRVARLIQDFRRVMPDLTDLSASHQYDTESALDYCRRRLDLELFHVFVDPLLRTYTLRGGAETSALTLFAALATVGGRNRVVSYREGIDRLPLALAKNLDIRLSCAASRVQRNENGVAVQLTPVSGHAYEEHADACVIATRAPEAAFLSAEFASKATTFIDRLRYNEALTVHLGYRQRTHSGAGSVMIPTREHARVGVLLLDHNKRDNYAPHGGSQFKCCFDAATLGGSADIGDDEAIRMTAEFVERLFPEIRGTCDMMHVTRLKLGVPHPEPGMYKTLHQARLRFDSRDRVQFAGDYLSTIGMNSAVHYGRRAAANLVSHFGGAATPT